MFFYTSKSEKHSHIAYLNKDARYGQTSVEKGHSHRISYQEAQSIAVDPEAQALVGAQTSGGYYLEPAADGHTHSIVEVVKPKEKKATGDDTKIAEECRYLFKVARELEAESREKAEESEGFYDGTKQWSEEDRKKLESEERAALKFNQIESKIDLLSGYQRQNRFDIKYFPTEGGDAAVADVLTYLAKNINDSCDFDFEETKVFNDEMIPGRGCFHVFIDRSRDIRGEIVTERFPWRDCYFGPHEKEDLSDCEHAHKAKWFSKSKAKQKWPDKAKDLETTFDIYDSGKRLKGYASNQYDHPDSQTPAIPGYDPELVSVARKELRIIETIRKEYERVTVLVNTADDVVVSTSGWDSKDVSAAKTITGFYSIPQDVTRFRITTWAAGVVLEDRYSQLDDYSLVPVYAKKRGDAWWGKVEASKDPQREINKRRSQTADILNKMDSYGWFYDSQTFENEKEEKKFKRNSAKPGFTQKVMDVSRPPNRIEGVKYPSELVNLIMSDSAQMREILNINMEMQGVSGGSMSGIAIAEKKRSGLVGNEFLFDNLSMAKRKIGRLYLKLIPQVYTPERIIRLLENSAAREAAKIQGVPFDKIPPEQKAAITRILEDGDLSRYDVAVGESAYSPTARLANFAMFMELAQKGMQIPPALLIELSPLPDQEKAKAIEQISQMMQQQAQQEKQKYDTEIQKTILSKAIPQGGGMPPGMQGAI